MNDKPRKRILDIRGRDCLRDKSTSLSICPGERNDQKPAHSVILSEAKNLESNLDRSTNRNRQRCFASLNMTAPFMRWVDNNEASCDAAGLEIDRAYTIPMHVQDVELAVCSS